MHTGSLAKIKNEILPWVPPHVSADLCDKCGRIGRLVQWWKISFCRACLCFSVRIINVAP
jgi:hypothetical protein